MSGSQAFQNLSFNLSSVEKNEYVQKAELRLCFSSETPKIRTLTIYERSQTFHSRHNDSNYHDGYVRVASTELKTNEGVFPLNAVVRSWLQKDKLASHSILVEATFERRKADTKPRVYGEICL